MRTVFEECLETMQDLKANNAESEYLKGLENKIKAVEKRSIISEFSTAAFISSAQIVLKNRYRNSCAYRYGTVD